MSIERFGNIHIVVCDVCGGELPYEYDFYDVIEAKKAAGWKSVKAGPEWFDFCPTCYKEATGAAADFAEISNS